MAVTVATKRAIGEQKSGGLKTSSKLAMVAAHRKGQNAETVRTDMPEAGQKEQREQIHTRTVRTWRVMKELKREVPTAEVGIPGQGENWQ